MAERSAALDSVGDDEIAKAAEKEPKGTEAIIIAIRQIQKDIDSRPNTYSQHANRDTEFNNFKGRLRQCADRFSEAVSDVRRNQQVMARVRLALFELRDAKAHPTLTPAILGSGPEGAGTAITKDLIQEHSEVLAAKTSFVALNDSKAALRRLEEETRRVRTENEDVKQLMESVEYEFEDRLQKLKASLAQAGGISTSGSEGRIREDDLIVEDEAENSIPDLQRSRP